MLIKNAQLMGHTKLLDVRCEEGLISAVAPSLEPRVGERVLPAAGAALLPGLHDHHLHLYALAALCNSVQCCPPLVSDVQQLQTALGAAAGTGWVRGVNYDESLAGVLHSRALDCLINSRPVKIQHRSGKLWMVNTLGAQRLSLQQHIGMPGIELDALGQPTGRLFRLDGWMREQLSAEDGPNMPSLSDVSRLLASFGVTGVTDASPDNGVFTLQHMIGAVSAGQLLQRVRVMGGDALPDPQRGNYCAQVTRGERKVMLDEDRLPDWATLQQTFDAAHRQGRGVAVHCVTATELVLTLAVLREVGAHPQDRIEHASMVPEEILPLLQQTHVRVVTQPGFVRERGDRYLREIDVGQHAALYRCKHLLDHGIAVAGSTDAPYGNPDPWLAMRAAVDRRSVGGQLLGAAERVDPEQALGLFTSAADDPGGAARVIRAGVPADLCLLRCPWEQARLRLCSDDVRATIVNAKVIYDSAQPRAFGGRYATVAA